MIISKKTLFRIAFFAIPLFFVSMAKAQTDQVEGLWYNDVKSGKILITRESDGKFYGKVVWLKEPLKNGKPKVDELNADPKLRSRPRLGLQVLSGFIKDGDTKYTDGTIYDPLNGKTYSCNMTFKGKTLAIRGFIGISLFGRTTTWSRAE
ncbi:DUF2147 domain-containing protein [Mucilaginibacter sp. BJC16-A38]|uniref:DUF2147 domain-containing protein n=1 Tax=Mucilaginibacter phenanthrenivorans TaxID=1234842 RepID=UPI0021572339|nr:DUF2147 domain-containing protein [Mucilaginibacter phenanthrenivorans]MCR8556246.1 DUF2147 domain-containing protein [Mucilaginibacter phenanthrenivorans]